MTGCNDYRWNVMTIDEMNIYEMNIYEMNIYEMTTDEMTVGAMTVDKMNAHKMRVNEMTVDKMSGQRNAFRQNDMVPPSLLKCHNKIDACFYNVHLKPKFWPRVELSLATSIINNWILQKVVESALHLSR